MKSDCLVAQDIWKIGDFVPKRINKNHIPFIQKTLGKLPGSSKDMILLWKILSDSIPIGGEFARRRLDVHPFCPLCKQDSMIETLEHLFRDYPVVGRIWAGSILGIRTDSLSVCGIKDWIINWINLLMKRNDDSRSILCFL